MKKALGAAASRVEKDIKLLRHVAPEVKRRIDDGVGVLIQAHTGPKFVRMRSPCPRPVNIANRTVSSWTMYSSGVSPLRSKRRKPHRALPCAAVTTLRRYDATTLRRFQRQRGPAKPRSSFSFD